MPDRVRARYAAAARLHLASASPRRRDILDGLGFVYTAGGVDVDERRASGEEPAQMVARLAADKVRAARAGQVDDVVVLGADTAVVLDGRVFGKPADEADAVRMLAELSGRSHEVLTGVAVMRGARLDSAVSRTTVRFRDVEPEEAAIYWQSGEPVDKAGGYAIQGLGGIFVAELVGSYSGVVGLPVFETACLLADAGITVLGRERSVCQ